MLESGEWEPTPQEAHLAREVMKGMWRDAQHPPPHRDEGLEVRLGRLWSTAPLLRLALAVDRSAFDDRLVELLAGYLVVAEWAEQMNQEHSSAVSPHGPLSYADGHQQFLADRPELMEQLDGAERARRLFISVLRRVSGVVG
ncbi:hypothetical protein DPM19_10900 [Actinomadura craniellae]|uniref:Uncharacterized protein n=1 Tax=Actinomadura craniellae TaxID=2231787 RepID=A0A365H866_9ACTN|nr:hypothetical protein DPM19_10900 [Actinomadura craniellae]